MAHNLFISHSWAYSDAYEKLINLLNAADNFDYKNYSVPKNDPIHNANNARQLTEAIKAQMSPCGVVIILAGVYSTYSTWINTEISLAAAGFLRPKPILAIEPFASQRTSTVVRNAANKVVAWNTKSIVAAIKELSN